MIAVNKERDKEIIQRYKSGEHTLDALARTYKVSRARICQILKKEGVRFKDTPRCGARNRYAYIGINITKPVKAAFEREARRRGKTMSQLGSIIVELFLKHTYGVKNI